MTTQNESLHLFDNDSIATTDRKDLPNLLARMLCTVYKRTNQELLTADLVAPLEHFLDLSLKNQAAASEALHELTETAKASIKANAKPSHRVSSSELKEQLISVLDPWFKSYWTMCLTTPASSQKQTFEDKFDEGLMIGGTLNVQLKDEPLENKLKLYTWNDGTPCYGKQASAIRNALQDPNQNIKMVFMTITDSDKPVRYVYICREKKVTSGTSVVANSGALQAAI